MLIIFCPSGLFCFINAPADAYYHFFLVWVILGCFTPLIITVPQLPFQCLCTFRGGGGLEYDHKNLPAHLVVASLVESPS